MSKNYYLVINLGLRSIRAILFDEKGSIVEKNWYPIQTIIYKDQVEQNPNEWFKLCFILIEELVNKNELYRQNLKAITITSSACSLVLLDKSGEPIINSYIVSDKRAVRQAKIFKNPNNQAQPSFMIPKILWIKENLPHIFKKAAYFMGANDFLIYKLTGRFVTDTLNAEKFYWDSLKKEFPIEMIKYLELSKERFPEVLTPGTNVGPLHLPLYKKFGLKSSPSVILSTYDAICAFLASSTFQEGEAVNIGGTVSSFRVFTKKPVSGKKNILSQKYDDFRIVGGSNNIDGGLLEWSRHVFYGDGYPENFVHKIIESEAADSPVGSRGLFFSPYLGGERFPFTDHTARGIFFGVERFHKRADFMRSVFEASGFMAYDILAEIEKLGIQIKQVRMSGGLTQSNLICKIRADILGKKVLVLNETETTSIGAFMIMLKSLGQIKDFSEMTDLLSIKESFAPNLKNHRIYKKLFTFFKKIYKKNKGLMAERNKILNKIQKGEKYILENL